MQGNQDFSGAEGELGILFPCSRIRGVPLEIQLVTQASSCGSRGSWDSSYFFSIFKSRDITLPTKVHLVKAMVFPVVMYGCESGTVKKAEHRRTDAFEL